MSVENQKKPELVMRIASRTSCMRHLHQLQGGVRQAHTAQPPIHMPRSIRTGDSTITTLNYPSYKALPSNEDPRRNDIIQFSRINIVLVSFLFLGEHIFVGARRVTRFQKKGLIIAAATIGADITNRRYAATLAG